MNQTPSTSPATNLTVDEALDAVVASFGGLRREGQHEMANSIAKAMQSGEHLLVQAGTGTGKSLGYLIPAILRAAKNSGGSKARTIIATATIALQRQLVTSDLPKAMAALGDKLPQAVNFAVLKGRNNYVCLEKFNRDNPGSSDEESLSLFEESTSRLARQAKKLRKWIQTTETGDKDDFGDEIDSRLWRSLSVSGRECIGKNKCLYGESCFAELARENAYQSEIVVTNHTMLALDVIEQVPLLPEHEVIVIDEAHELVDQTTRALSGELTVSAIERAAGLIRKFIDSATHTRMLEVADELGKVLDNYEASFSVERIPEVVGSLRASLTDIRDVCKVAASELTTSSTDDPETATAKQRAKVAVSEITEVSAALLGTDQHSVTWLDRTRAPILHHAPLSVSGYLREALFAKSTVVLTSATLQVGGSMDDTARAVGLIAEKRIPEFEDTPAEEDDPWGENEVNWSALDVGSPFDYPRQGILYCASHLQPPSQDGVAEEAFDELAELIEAAGGRSLCLFSAWRSVERAADYLRVRLASRPEIDLIVAQRGESTSTLVEKFKANPRAVLLGTRSFWQGIDAPGATCTLVAIDRIPFPRPDEPVYAARSARADELGQSGFNTVSIPRAGLLLAQGVGRLIRSMDDRGVAAVLDSRLANARYGQRLRKSLPPMYWTTDKSSVLSALRRLDESSD
ncbi:MAG: ATP-dependent DNA helicase [Actinomycetales bacterium]|nr:ATP-dependent DNA helicase [Actinomycetales bacterium]